MCSPINALRAILSPSCSKGFEMGRPSLIGLDMTLADGKLTSATIGGSAVIVSEGTIEA